MAKAVAMELAMVLCAALVSGAMSAMGDCDCMATWDYDGNNDSTMETYEGCSATADWDQTWCYVEGGDKCNQYQNSSVAGETRKWRECGTCNCLETWDYDGDNDSTMETYDGCSATADWDQTWCYVQGGSNCNQYQNSSVAGETRKWRECGTCNCMTEWNYDGDGDGVFESYDGCSATADWDQTWCYVQGGDNCNQYQNSSVAGETRKWRECGTCNCMTEWNYDGDGDGEFESYDGCSATADWDQTWCYVQGGDNCNQYQNSSVAGETRKWRECGTCNCMTEWNYDGDDDGAFESYDGCSATADWDQTWCYVQGGDNCNQYLNSTVDGETRKWRECGSCNCMTEWNYDGDADGVFESYDGCSTTADWNQTWCYVQGGTNCNQYQDSSVAGETRKWRECEPCNCMTEWNYDGDADGVFESYDGCSATADWNQTWCYIQGGTNCNLYQNSSVAGETRKWRECEPSATTSSADADEDDADEDDVSGAGEPTMAAAIIAVIFVAACA